MHIYGKSRTFACLQKSVIYYLLWCGGRCWHTGRFDLNIWYNNPGVYVVTGCPKSPMRKFEWATPCDTPNLAETFRFEWTSTAGLSLATVVREKYSQIFCRSRKYMSKDRNYVGRLVTKSRQADFGSKQIFGEQNSSQYVVLGLLQPSTDCSWSMVLLTDKAVGTYMTGLVQNS